MYLYCNKRVVKYGIQWLFMFQVNGENSEAPKIKFKLKKNK